MTLPKHLYHYTSQKGILGILESNKLWMTNILYLNDSSEFTYTLELVRSKLKKLKEQKQNIGILTPNDVKYEQVERVLDGFFNDKRTESYVFSLSNSKKKDDDLNQWRGYCPREGGFCIEFDSGRLFSIIEKMNKMSKGKYEISECIYHHKDEPIESVESLIRKITEADFYKELVEISSYIKDNSFEDEKEYRIIYQGVPNEINFRGGISMIIPYIELPHIQFSPVDDVLPITKIMVGPTTHKELSRLSIRYILEQKGYDIDVEISKIPYRSM